MKKSLTVILLSVLLLTSIFASSKKSKSTTENAPSWAKFAINDDLVGAKSALNISTTRQAFIIKNAAKNQNLAYAQATFKAYKNMAKLFAEQAQTQISPDSLTIISNSCSYNGLTYNFSESMMTDGTTTDHQINEQLTIDSVFLYNLQQHNEEIEDVFLFSDQQLSKTSGELKISDLTSFMAAFNNIFPELQFKEEASYTTDAASGSMCVLVYSYDKAAFDKILHKMVEQALQKFLSQPPINLNLD